MPQIFRRSANTLSKVSIFGLLSLVGGLILLAIVLARSTYVTRQQIFVEQPLQFSHMHHVTDDGIDCRYCHTSVETSSFAGIPPTKTCMNCHSVLFANAAFLEPVRASFRDNRPLHWVPRPRSSGLRLLQPQHPHQEGRRLRDVPRAHRPDAVDLPAELAADGVVHRLP
jgi:hypothetical protein